MVTIKSVPFFARGSPAPHDRRLTGMSGISHAAIGKDPSVNSSKG